MSDILAGLVELSTDCVQHASHGLSAIEHAPGLLVTLHVVLNLPLELLVDLLVFDDLKHE